MRIYAISDLHVDFAANLTLLETLPPNHAADVLLLAGDVSHRLERTEVTLRLLTQRFARVLFVPGNHDLWLEEGVAEADTSLDRLTGLMALCDRLGVQTGPAAVGDDWWVVPLHGWYEAHFGAPDGPPVSEEVLARRWSDHRRCRWPSSLGDDAARCAHFASRNEVYPAPPDGRRVLTFSHFVPRPDLIPPLERLRFKQLPRVSGTLRLERQLRAVGSEIHVFGHTHIPWDASLDGVRYVQRPLAYPWERKRRGEEGIELARVV